MAVLYADKKITYGAIYDSVNRFGNALLSLGIGKGDPVILRIANRPEFIVAALAIHKIGAVPVPTMMLLREKTLTHIANASGAKLMIVDADLLDEVEKGKARYERLNEFIVIGGSRGSYHSYEELLDKQSPGLDPVPIERDELGNIRCGLPGPRWVPVARLSHRRHHQEPRLPHLA